MPHANWALATAAYRYCVSLSPARLALSLPRAFSCKRPGLGRRSPRVPPLPAGLWGRSPTTRAWGLRSSPSGISSEFQLRKLVASQLSAQPGGGTRRRPKEASPAAGGRPRHQEHRQGGGGNKRRLSPGDPRPAPSGPLPRSARVQRPPKLAGTPHAPFHSTQAGKTGVPSPRAPQIRVAR